MKFFALASSILSLVGASDVALYWGQASAGSQKSLADYCQNSAGDIYIISFITTFGSGRQLGMNIAGYNDFFSGTNLLNAPELGSEIKTCQSLGKKVLISLGGASGSYGFDSDADAESVAQDVWNYFGGGTSSTRPFGDAKIDGFDLDGENNIDAQYYVPFVNKLRQLYSTDASKQYYVSAAPQCPFPDATVGQAVAHADLDFLFVQFYNNYCSLTGSNFNWDTWQTFASQSSPNKNVKLFLGLPGSPSAAGSGYATIDEIKAKESEYINTPNFGGFMVWDASQANQNIVDGTTFAQQLKNIGAPQPASSSAASVSPATSSSTASAPATSSSAAPAPVSTSSSAASVPVTTSSEAGSAPAPPASTASTSPVAVVTSSNSPAGPASSAEGAGSSPAASQTAVTATTQAGESAGQPAGQPAASTSGPAAGSAGAGGNVVTVQTVVTATATAAVETTVGANGVPNYQFVDTTSTYHTTSTVQSNVQNTRTVTSEPVRTTSAPLTRYTSDGEVYVIDYTYQTQYTTVWEGACSTSI